MKTAKITGSVVVTALLLLTTLSQAQSTVIPQTGDDYTVQIMPGPNQNQFGRNAQVDIGVVSRENSKTKRAVSSGSSYTVTRNIRLRITQRSGRTGHVIVRAFLLHDCYPCKLRLDGTELGISPTLVMNSSELNVVTEHRIEIEIPISMPAGAIDAEIGWQVEQQ